MFANAHDAVDFWSSASWLGPACIFAPSCVEEMSAAVKNLAKLRVPFAMRGGGHMPIGTSNNINSSGVLISSSNLKQLQIGSGQKTVTVGSGNVWSDVYKYLEPYGKVVVGGRLGPIGVPGFLLGGGMSFYSNQHGFGSGNIAKYTVFQSTHASIRQDADFCSVFWVAEKSLKPPLTTNTPTSSGLCAEAETPLHLLPPSTSRHTTPQW